MIPRGLTMSTMLIALLSIGCGTHYGLRSEAVVFEMGCPRLGWAAFPSEAELEADEQGALARARDVRYELRVYRAADGVLVLERRGIPETSYLVTVELRPGEYRWTVRPRFTSDGRPRVGQWSMDTVGPFRNAVLPVSIESYPSFHVRARR